MKYMDMTLFKLTLGAASLCFAQVAFSLPSVNSSSNANCVAGGGVVSSTSVSFSGPLHTLRINANHFTKKLPGGAPVNIHPQNSSQPNTASHNQSHTEPNQTGEGITSNEFNVDAEHLYIYCDPEVEDFSRFSSAKKECSI